MNQAPSNGTDTSDAAAESLEGALDWLETKVYRFVASCDEGATSDEVEVALGLAHQTASARINGLMGRGALVDSGARRKTRSGRRAIVWTADADGLLQPKKPFRRSGKVLIKARAVIAAWAAVRTTPHDHGDTVRQSLVALEEALREYDGVR